MAFAGALHGLQLVVPQELGLLLDKHCPLQSCVPVGHLPPHDWPTGMYFERAFELKADPAILYNAALSHRLAGNKDRALALYQNYLRVFGHVGKWTEVEARVAELKTAIAEDQALAPPPAAKPVEAAGGEANAGSAGTAAPRAAARHSPACCSLAARGG